jgi:nucleolar protein 14
VERYAIERKRNRKKMKFDLDSDQEDMQNVKLTHGGQELDDIFEYNDDRKQGSDDEEYHMDDNIVNKLHFGGKDIDSDQDDDFIKVKKTKEEVFKEIVTKSKIFKAARAEVKDQNEEMIDKLDEEFPDIFPLLKTREKTIRGADQTMSLLEVSKLQSDKEIAKKSDMRKRDQKHIKKSYMNTDYNYDSLTVSMRDDAKARPRMLIKSEKDKAIDRKAEMLKLEKQMRENDEVADGIDVSEHDGSVEHINDPDKLNNALIDLIENEYNDNDSSEPDDFEAIEEAEEEST